MHGRLAAYSNHEQHTHVVAFNKTFETGNLAGLTVDQQVTFATREAADTFAKKIAGKRNTDCLTGAKFVYSNVEVR